MKKMPYNLKQNIKERQRPQRTQTIGLHTGVSFFISPKQFKKPFNDLLVGLKELRTIRLVFHLLPFMGNQLRLEGNNMTGTSTHVGREYRWKRFIAL